MTFVSQKSNLFVIVPVPGWFIVIIKDFARTAQTKQYPSDSSLVEMEILTHPFLICGTNCFGLSQQYNKK